MGSDLFRANVRHCARWNFVLFSRDVKLEFFPKSKLGSKKSSKNWNSNSVCPMSKQHTNLRVRFTTGEFVETLVWLTIDTVVITAYWWGEGSAASSLAGRQYCASWCRCHGEAGIRLQSPFSPISWITWRSHARRMSFDLLFNGTC